MLSHFLNLSQTDRETKQSWRKSSMKLHHQVPKIFKIQMRKMDIRSIYSEDQSNVKVFQSRKLAESSRSISISVVRNPFERWKCLLMMFCDVMWWYHFVVIRLVSAYQDKIVTSGHFLKMKSLMERYYGFVSFPNFVTLILRKAGRLCRWDLILSPAKSHILSGQSGLVNWTSTGFLWSPGVATVTSNTPP